MKACLMKPSLEDLVEAIKCERLKKHLYSSSHNKAVWLDLTKH
jgi:hypothetical protein